MKYKNSQASEKMDYGNEEEGLKVLLVTCPQSHPPTSPHPALPYLTGFLKERIPEVKVNQKDLDAIYYSWIFSTEQLQKQFPTEEAEKIREAYNTQQDAGAYENKDRFLEAKRTLESTLKAISQRHRRRYHLKKEGITLRGNTFTYVSEYETATGEGILETMSTENREKNIFYGYFREYVIPHIKEGKYDIVGFSVFLTDQLIPTYLLASMIKELLPEVSVIFGGNYLTRFKDVLATDDKINQGLMKSIDAYIIGEGEVPFTQLVTEYTNAKKEKRTPNLDINQVIRMEEGHIKIRWDAKSLPRADMNELPRPDFDEIFTDFEGKRVFWTPEDIVSLYTEKGCPFATKCDFCTIPYGNNIKTGTGARSAEIVAKDIEYFKRKNGIRIFSFGNETLSGRFMEELSDRLNVLNLSVTLDGYTRTDQFETPERKLDEGRIKKIGRYFRFLQIGFESNDQETLESMKKRRSPLNDAELAQKLFRSGIYPHAFLMIGYPPEKEGYQGKERDAYINYYVTSAIKTLKWLMDNKWVIGTYKATHLMIPRDDDKMVRKEEVMHVVASGYDHEIVLGTPRRFEFNVPYEKTNGSRRLDKAIKDVFESIRTPYQKLTHYTIYHQRLIPGMWRRITDWSKEEIEGKKECERKQEQKALRKLWTAAVGEEYVNAQQELSKKGGVSKQKKARLNAEIRRTQEKNIIARNFPENIPSIEALMNMRARL